MRQSKLHIHGIKGSRNGLDSSVGHCLVITTRKIQLLPLVLFMWIEWDPDGKVSSHKADVYEAWYMVMLLIFHTAMATGRIASVC